jgi:hypothetical protein
MGFRSRIWVECGKSAFLRYAANAELRTANAGLKSSNSERSRNSKVALWIAWVQMGNVGKKY